MPLLVDADRDLCEQAQRRNMPVNVYNELNLATQSMRFHIAGDFETNLEHMEALARDVLANLNEVRRYREMQEHFLLHPRIGRRETQPA